MKRVSKSNALKSNMSGPKVILKSDPDTKLKKNKIWHNPFSRNTHKQSDPVVVTSEKQALLQEVPPMSKTIRKSAKMDFFPAAEFVRNMYKWKKMTDHDLNLITPSEFEEIRSTVAKRPHPTSPVKLNTLSHQIFPATSPQARIYQSNKVKAEASESILRIHKTLKRNSSLPSIRSKVRTSENVKSLQNANDTESVLNLKQSPGITEMPKIEGQKSPFRTGGIFRPRNPSDHFIPHESLKPKPANVDITKPRIATVTSDQQPATALKHLSRKEMKQQAAQTSDVSPESVKVIGRSRKIDTLEKYYEILPPNEIPSSTYLLKFKKKTKPQAVPDVAIADKKQAKVLRKVKPLQNRIKDEKRLSFVSITSSSSVIPRKIKPKFQKKLGKIVSGNREGRRRHIVAKYNWRLLVNGVISVMRHDKSELEEQERLKLEENKKDQAKQVKKKHQGFFTWIIRLLDEDDISDDEDDFDLASMEASEHDINKLEVISNNSETIRQQHLAERREQLKAYKPSMISGHAGRVTIVEIPPQLKERKDSDTIKNQQISAAFRRLHRASNFSTAPVGTADTFDPTNIRHNSYEDFVHEVMETLPSTHGVPDHDAATRLFGHLVPLLQGRTSSGARADDEEKIEAAEDAFEEYRAAAIHKERLRSLIQANTDTEKKLSKIRYLPGSLEHRREVKTYLQEVHANATYRKRIKYFFDDIQTIIKSRIGEIFQIGELWHHQLHDIEMNFGVGSSSYFRWLRALMILNIIYLILSLSLIVIPELRTNALRPFHNLTMENLIFPEDRNGHANLFYGYYNYVPKAASHNSSAWGSTAFRFLLLMIFVLLIDTIFIGMTVHQYFRRMIAKISDSDKAGDFNFPAMVLSAWDYSATSNHAVMVQRRTIARDFNEVMDRYENKLKKDSKSKYSEDEYDMDSSLRSKIKRIFVHWMINLAVVFGAFAFVFILFIILVLNSSDLVKSRKSKRIIKILCCVCTGLALHISSPICAWLTESEKFKRVSTHIFVLALRLGAIYINVIWMYESFWFYSGEMIKIDEGEAFCWEEMVGTEIYRIIIFEGLANAGTTLIRYVIYPSLKAKWLKREFQKREFDLEYFTLNLFFVHTLCGAGIFVFPLIPFVVIVRLVLSFYWHKFILIHYCEYPTFRLHPSEVYAPYVIAFYFTYISVTISNIWVISEQNPSSGCGPFQGYSNKTYAFVFKDVAGNGGFGRFVEYIVTPWFLYFTVLILCGIVYMFREWTAAYVDTMNYLHDRLRLERLDREFLLRAIYSIPGLYHGKKKGDSLENNGKNRSDSEKRSLLIKQQEALAKIFKTSNAQCESPCSTQSGSSLTSSTHSNLSTEVKEQKGNPNIETQPAKHMYLDVDTPNIPGKGITPDHDLHTYRGLMLSSRALHTLRSKDRRLSRAGNIYNELLEVAMKEAELETNLTPTSSLMDNKTS